MYTTASFLKIMGTQSLLT